jgi:hypothetical protein
MRNPLAPFRDPVRRPRAIIWTLTGLMIAMVLFAGLQAFTSTAWFCNDVCHTVHFDNARAWKAGPHSTISCIACHYPVNMNAVGFALDRLDKLADLPPTIFGTYEVPVNEHSHLGLVTESEQCTQCHNMQNRKFTPTRGMIIDHAVHAENEVTCGVCHNRVAHPEEKITLELPGNLPKQDFMGMSACFRCHTLTGEAPGEYNVSGACELCHNEKFDLVPASHEATAWYTFRGASAGHADAAKEEASHTAEAIVEWDEIAEEFMTKRPRIIPRLLKIEDGFPPDIPPATTINDCYTCHVRESFCDACHGTEVPHPEGFVASHYEEFQEADAVDCAKCHNKTGTATNDALTCTLCHHPAWDPAKAGWLTTHPAVVRSDGADPCYSCHVERFCASCHVHGEPATPY